jgi:hypothetical protein
MGPKALLAAHMRSISAKQAERVSVVDELKELRGQDAPDQDKVNEALSRKEAIDAELDNMYRVRDDLQREIAEDEAAAERAAQTLPGAELPEERAVTQRAEIRESRTYTKEKDRSGKQFLQDVVRAQVYNDLQARQRVERHMAEEIVERGAAIEERAASSSNFSGVVVPQYLVDQFAGVARAGRPFADAARPHDLPETGMTVEIGRGTTGTSSGVQSSENTSVSETDYDDTILSIPVRTAAGSQTISRQAAQRGAGALDITIEDLFDAHATDLDQQLITTASVGLSAAATATTYTDETPTQTELLPKFLAAQAGLQAALLNKYKNDAFAVMTPTRWLWLNAAMVNTWPMLGQPGVAAQNAGINYAEKYGQGYAGTLPNGLPVVLDANVPTNLGTGTNQDEIYVVPQSECHLWEDPNAPFFIQAEQPNAKKLGIDIVVYSFFAFTFGRYPSAIRKISGTGLVAPTF